MARKTKAAEATTETTETKPRAMASAGGKKGQAILEVITANPEMTRNEVAEAAGATVARVGEVIRFMLANPEEDGHEAVVAFQEASDRARAERAEAKEAAKAEAKAAREAARAEAKAAKEAAKAEAKAKREQAKADKAAAAEIETAVEEIDEDDEEEWPED